MLLPTMKWSNYSKALPGWNLLVPAMPCQLPPRLLIRDLCASTFPFANHTLREVHPRVQHQKWQQYITALESVTSPGFWQSSEGVYILNITKCVMIFVLQILTPFWIMKQQKTPFRTIKSGLIFPHPIINLHSITSISAQSVAWNEMLTKQENVTLGQRQKMAFISLLLTSIICFWSY